ncbi:MAG: carbohydrate kinase family protein [Spirochaetaceae bacterium]|jgi:sugar/nucleoside kinase (ribokinase family)|nr:carbohydrate kinase family protein [Spirochaetaceae bacterium]
MPVKVMSAGHICLDISLQLNKDWTLTPGSLSEVGAATMHPGGSVGNTGAALHYFGVDTVLAAKIGNDTFGDILQNMLSLPLIRDPNESTSYTIVIAPPGVERSFLHNPGANHSFCAADITDEMLSTVSHFHFGYPPLLKKMYQNDGAELVSLFKRAKQLGITTSLDMVEVDPASEAGKLNWQTLIANVLPFVDYFVPSLEELCFMLKTDMPDITGMSATQNTNTIHTKLNILAKTLLEYGTKTVLIKCGPAGMYYHCAEENGFVQSYPEEQYVSTTGAGDTSIAAFLAERLNGKALKHCVEVACVAGAACISAYDALSGLKPLTELEKVAIEYYE